MFSNEKCYKPMLPKKTPLDLLMNICLSDLSTKINCCASIISECSTENNNIHILGSKNIEISTFKCSKKRAYKEFFSRML